MTAFTDKEINFLRLFKLTNHVGSLVLAKHIEEYCNTKYISFEEYLNENEHRIFHFKKSTKQRCCCNDKLRSVIHERQWKKLYKYNKRRHEFAGHDGTGDCFYPFFAIPSIDPQICDVSLACAIITNDCEILRPIWNSIAKSFHSSFSEFLREKLHSLYNCITRRGIIRRRPGTDTQNLDLNEMEWNELFDTYQSPPGCKCRFVVKDGIKIEDLSECLVKKLGPHIGEIPNLRNIRNEYAHVSGTNMQLDDQTFEKDWTERATIIKHLARVTESDSFYHEIETLIDTIKCGAIVDKERQTLLAAIEELKEINESLADDVREIRSNQGKEEQIASIDGTIHEMEQHRSVEGLQTKAFNESFHRFDEYGVVLITGKTGQGKTWTALEILTTCEDEYDYKTFVKIDASQLEIHKWNNLTFGSNGDNPAIVFVDNLQSKHLENKKEVFETIQAAVTRKKAKVVATMSNEEQEIWRKQTDQALIFGEKHQLCLSDYESTEENEKLLKLKIEQSNNVTIVGNETDETFENTENIKMSEQTINAIARKRTDIGFPQCCVDFLSNPDYRKLGKSYFEQPFKTSIQKMIRLTYGGKEQKLSFFVMSSMLIFDTKFQGTENSQNEIPLKILLSIDDFSQLDLQNAMARLPSSWIKDNKDGSYEFQHDSIKRTLFFAFAERGGQFEKYLIENCPVQHLNLVLDEWSHSKERESWKYKLGNADNLIKRFISEMHGDPTYENVMFTIVNHRSMSDETFVNKLKDVCQGKHHRCLNKYAKRYKNKILEEIFIPQESNCQHKNEMLQLIAVIEDEQMLRVQKIGNNVEMTFCIYIIKNDSVANAHQSIEGHLGSEHRQPVFFILNRSYSFRSIVEEMYKRCSKCLFLTQDTENVETFVKQQMNEDSAIIYEEHGSASQQISSCTLVRFCENHFHDFYGSPSPCNEFLSDDLQLAIEELSSEKRKHVSSLLSAVDNEKLCSLFPQACELGHIDCLEAILKKLCNYCPQIPEQQKLETYMQGLEKCSSAKAIDIIASWTSDILTDTCIEKLFNEACSRNCGQSVRYLITRYFANSGNKISSEDRQYQRRHRSVRLSTRQIAECFISACENGHLEVGEVLLQYSYLPEDLIEKMTIGEVIKGYEAALEYEKNEMRVMIEKYIPAEDLPDNTESSLWMCNVS